MKETLTFLIVVEIIHFLTLPITWLIFRRERDEGYGIGKILGPVILSFLVWILPILGILPFTRWTIGLILALLGCLSFLIYRKNSEDIKGLFSEKRNLIYLIEGLFIVSFLLFAFIRSYNPEISYDVNLYAAEKFPDMAFFHAILRTDSLPPPDVWFSGPENYINYYYYGYFVQAVPLKLAAIMPWKAYNLALCMIFASAITAAFSLLYNLTGKRLIGVAAALFLNVMGNLYGFLYLLSGKKFGPLELWKGSRVITKHQITVDGETHIYKYFVEFFKKLFGGEGLIKDRPASDILTLTIPPGTPGSKEVDATINETPIFSYILGDLHAHLLAVPLSLLVLHFLFMFFKNVREPVWEWVKKEKTNGLALLFFTISLGSLICGNYWDLPTYFLLAGVMFIVVGILSPERVKTAVSWVLFHYDPVHATWKAPDRVKTAVSWVLSLGIIFVLIRFVLFLPFFMHYSPPAAKLKFLEPHHRSMVGQFLTIHFFLIFLAAFFMAVIWIYRSSLVKKGKLIGLIVSVLAMLSTCVIFQNFTISLLSFLLLAAAYLLFFHKGERHEKLNMSLILVAFSVLLGCEFVYIKDFYGVSAARMNTVFKFYYVAWIFLSLSGAASFYYVFSAFAERDKKVWANIFRFGTVFLFAASMIYPIQAIGVKTDYFEKKMGRPTLNGFAYIRERFPQDYKAIQWMMENLEDEPVVLEATGAPYSYHGRVSTMTGFPTVIGWGNHEALWRDWSWKKSGDRTNDVRTMYKSLDTKEVYDLLRKYDVRYVFIGSLENKEFYSYDQNGREKFKNLGELVYDRNEVNIFEINQEMEKNQVAPYRRDPSLIIPKEKGRVVVNEKGMTTLEDKKALKIWGRSGSGAGEFKDPKDIAVSPDGHVYVADSQNHRIQKFDLNGQFITEWGKRGEGPGEFHTPVGLGIAGNGDVYVADTWNHRIQIFDSEGKFKTEWRSPHNMWAPKDVAVSEKGVMYIVDTGLQRVHKVESDLKNSRFWGEKGDEPGKLFEPVGIELGNDGKVYVADTANQRISVFNEDGKHQADWYVLGWEEFYSEPFLAMSPDGLLVATDSRNNRLQIYNLEGNLLAVWESAGAASGQFNWPIGIDFDAEGNLYVTDSLNARIQKFSPFGEEIMEKVNQ